MTLHDLLAQHVKEGELYEKMPNNWVRCVACGHRCKIGPDRDGICKVRYNKGGVLYVPYGYVGGIQLDPIEKKPFFHALPGTNALSFGMLGCDYHCSYCQNWFTSQAIRDPNATASPVRISDVVKSRVCWRLKAAFVRSMPCTHGKSQFRPVPLKIPFAAENGLWLGALEAITIPPISKAKTVVISGTTTPPARWKSASRSATLGA